MSQPTTEAGKRLMAIVAHHREMFDNDLMPTDPIALAESIVAIEAEARAGCEAREARLREALTAIVGEAEEVTDAQHGNPIRALYTVIRRAEAALSPEAET